MDIIEMLEEIHRRDGIYIDGDRSLKRVRSFIVGYEVGAATTTRKLTDHLQFHEFHDWVAKRFGYGSSAQGWCNMILEKAGTDEKAYEMFFTLLEEFENQRTSTSRKVENKPENKSILDFAKQADRKGYSASALELFKLVISADPNKDSAIYRAVKNLIEVGRISEAEFYFNTIRRNAAPKPWLIELVLGELCMARSKLADAETHFRNAWQMNRKSTVPAIFLAVSLFRQEKFNDAKVVLLEALTAEGDLDEVYLKLGLAARATGKYSEARSHFLKALEISPEYPEAKRGLADVEFWLNFLANTNSDNGEANEG